MSEFKETKWAPKHTERLTCANAGLPTRGDPHGNGVFVVLKCSGQCLRQGEGKQGKASEIEKRRGRVMRKSEPYSRKMMLELESRVR